MTLRVHVVAVGKFQAATSKASAAAPTRRMATFEIAGGAAGTPPFIGVAASASTTAMLETTRPNTVCKPSK